MLHMFSFDSRRFGDRFSCFVPMKFGEAGGMYSASGVKGHDWDPIACSSCLIRHLATPYPPNTVQRHDWRPDKRLPKI